MNLLKKGIVAALATSLAAAPVVAQTRAADSLSVSRASETTEGENELRQSYFLPLSIIIVIILGLIIFTGDNDSHSP